MLIIALWHKTRHSLKSCGICWSHSYLRKWLLTHSFYSSVFKVNFGCILSLIKTLRKTVALSINRKFLSGLLRKSVESVSEK